MAAFTGSITGQVICGDGHVVSNTLSGVVQGPSSAQAFGAVTFTQTFPSTLVPSVPSAQSFGVPVIKATRTLALTGIISAQSFGAVTIKATIAQPSGGVPSAAAFGAITVSLQQTRIVAGIPSAQAFGTVRAVFPPQTVLVQGIDRLPYAIDSITGLVICGDGHLVGGMNVFFGRVHILYWQPLPLAGVPSAQQFGAITFHTTVTIQLGGVPSAAQFGAVTPHRYDLHLDCKPDGSLGLGCKPDGSFVITPRTDGSFAINPSSTGTFTLTPRTDGSVVLVPTDEDG